MKPMGRGRPVGPATTADRMNRAARPVRYLEFLPDAISGDRRPSDGDPVPGQPTTGQPLRPNRISPRSRPRIAIPFFRWGGRSPPRAESPPKPHGFPPRAWPQITLRFFARRVVAATGQTVYGNPGCLPRARMAEIGKRLWAAAGPLADPFWPPTGDPNRNNVFFSHHAGGSFLGSPRKPSGESRHGIGCFEGSFTLHPPAAPAAEQWRPADSVRSPGPPAAAGPTRPALKSARAPTLSRTGSGRYRVPLARRARPSPQPQANWTRIFERLFEKPIGLVGGSFRCRPRLGPSATHRKKTVCYERLSVAAIRPIREAATVAGRPVR